MAKAKTVTKTFRIQRYDPASDEITARAHWPATNAVSTPGERDPVPPPHVTPSR